MNNKTPRTKPEMVHLPYPGRGYGLIAYISDDTDLLVWSLPLWRGDRHLRELIEKVMYLASQDPKTSYHLSQMLDESIPALTKEKGNDVD